MRGCACGDRDGRRAFVHVSCLMEQAKLLVAEAEENNLDWDAKSERWARWYTCSLCEQRYHGVVACALGWACWKTFVGRPEERFLDVPRWTQLGNGLSSAKHHEDALSVQEADLAMKRRLGDQKRTFSSCRAILRARIKSLDDDLKALPMRRDVYSGRLKLYGEEHKNPHSRPTTTRVPSDLRPPRFEEAKVAAAQNDARGATRSRRGR